MNLHFPVHEVDDRNIGLDFLTGTIFWTLGPLTFISPVGAKVALPAQGVKAFLHPFIGIQICNEITYTIET